MKFRDRLLKTNVLDGRIVREEKDIIAYVNPTSLALDSTPQIYDKVEQTYYVVETPEGMKHVTKEEGFDVGNNVRVTEKVYLNNKLAFLGLMSSVKLEKKA
jgi:hypothetical protein